MKTTEVKSFADVDTSELKQPIICVFNKPDDYPDKYVARLFEGTAPTNIIITRGSNDRSTERMEGNAGRMERSSRSVRTHSESNTGSGKTDCKQFFRVL